MSIRALFILSLLLSSCVAAVSTGVIGLGINSAKDKTVGEALDDTTIDTKIKKEFISKGFKNLYAKINVEVVKGKVIYTGYVDNEEDIITAIDIAWNQKGVKEVVNELSVDENRRKFEASQYAKDSWITTQIKSKLFLNRDIKFINYTIVTTRNVVYLMGIAKSEEELEKVANIAASIKGVEKVISHVTLKNPENVVHPNT
jgi:osmotically-inducible protein OsmY